MHHLRIVVTVGIVMGLVSLVLACSSANDAETAESPAAASAPAEQPSIFEVYTLQQDVPMTISVTTTSLKPTGFFPKDFTCEGTDQSPLLKWTSAPDELESYVVVALDVDAEGGAFAHWLLWGVPPDVTELAAGASGSSEMPSGSVEGVNGFKSTGWKGPCPPPRVLGSANQALTYIQAQSTGVRSNLYLISVYALDARPDLDASSEMNDVLRAIDGHILAGGNLETRYISSVTIRK